MPEQAGTEMTARERTRATVAECRRSPLNHDNDGWSCGAHVTEAIEAAVLAEREAIAEFVSLYGSESGYTHVETLVRAIRERGTR